MALTKKEQNLLDELEAFKTRKDRYFMPDEDEMLQELIHKKYHKKCVNAQFEGYQGVEIETNCPKCGELLHDMNQQTKNQ